MKKLLSTLLSCLFISAGATAMINAEHPRLFVDAKMVNEIRAKLKEPAYARIFAAYEARYVGELKYGPKRVAPQEPKDKTQGEWRRGEGDAIAMLTVMYKVSGEAKYLKTLKEFLNEIVTYKEWDSGNRSDLVTGHLLLGLSMTYDWLYLDLDNELKAKIRDAVLPRANLLNYRIMHNWTWKDRLLNNHGGITATGLAAAGVAFAGDIPEASQWLATAGKYLQSWFKAQPTDGCGYEGVGYTEYALTYALLAADILRTYCGNDLYQAEWLREVGQFRIFSSLPEKSWNIMPLAPENFRDEAEKRMFQHVNSGQSVLKALDKLKFCVISFSDCRQDDFLTPDGMLWKLAAEYDAPELKAFGDKIAAADNLYRRNRYMNLIYFHEMRRHVWKKSVPAPLPTFKHYSDCDWAFMRSGWNGTENLLIFRCGPPAGHAALKKFNTEMGDGHVHPDVGAFTLFAAGDLMIINSEYCWKDTKHENTLLVNGIGQLGDNRKWADTSDYYRKKADPRILEAKSTASWDYVIGDATAAYRPEAGLKNFTRHILFLKPSCWVIMDEVESEKPATFELLFHSLQTLTGDGPRKARLTGSHGVLDFYSILPREATFTASTQPVRLIDGAAAPRPTQLLVLSNPEKTAKTVFLTILVARDKARKDDFQFTLTDSILKIVQNGVTRTVKVITVPTARLVVE